LEKFKIPKVFLYQLSPYFFFNLEIWPGSYRLIPSI
jgi:hypothetical protein